MFLGRKLGKNLKVKTAQFGSEWDSMRIAFEENDTVPFKTSQMPSLASFSFPESTR